MYQNDSSGAFTDVSQLNWQQLSQVHASLQNDVNAITQSYGSLRLAVGRFKTSEDCLSHISDENRGGFIRFGLGVGGGREVDTSGRYTVFWKNSFVCERDTDSVSQ